ncbi:hypothetical protein CLF_106168 [Clonorchis sinensis]|uniref:Uncharacterized protein n=1 Tax=Clonorchis sinensis TaxID=79923 RepID=G7YPR2_CLOSI|nr:hypothetical protein CLF_106168 [Clonorchis sinensis]
MVFVLNNTTNYFERRRHYTYNRELVSVLEKSAETYSAHSGLCGNTLHYCHHHRQHEISVKHQCFAAEAFCEKKWIGKELTASLLIILSTRTAIRLNSILVHVNETAGTADTIMHTGRRCKTTKLVACAKLSRTLENKKAFRHRTDHFTAQIPTSTRGQCRCLTVHEEQWPEQGTEIVLMGFYSSKIVKNRIPRTWNIVDTETTKYHDGEVNHHWSELSFTNPT